MSLKRFYQLLFTNFHLPHIPKDWCNQKEEGTHKSDSQYTAYCESIADFTILLTALLIDGHPSLHRLKPSPLYCWSDCNSIDPSTHCLTQYTPLTSSSHTDASPKCLHFIHNMYTLRKLKQTNLIVLIVLVPLLHPPLSCSTNLVTYQTQRKIQDIAEALSYRVLLSLSKIISLS
jgi:hypothetical protein